MKAEPRYSEDHLRHVDTLIVRQIFASAAQALIDNGVVTFEEVQALTASLQERFYPQADEDPATVAEKETQDA